MSPLDNGSRRELIEYSFVKNLQSSSVELLKYGPPRKAVSTISCEFHYTCCSKQRYYYAKKMNAGAESNLETYPQSKDVSMENNESEKNRGRSMLLCTIHLLHDSFARSHAVARLPLALKMLS